MEKKYLKITKKFLNSRLEYINLHYQNNEYPKAVNTTCHAVIRWKKKLYFKTLVLAYFFFKVKSS